MRSIAITLLLIAALLACVTEARPRYTRGKFGGEDDDGSGSDGLDGMEKNAVEMNPEVQARGEDEDDRELSPEQHRRKEELYNELYDDEGKLKRPAAIRYGTQNYRKVMGQLRRGKKLKDLNFSPESVKKREERLEELRKSRSRSKPLNGRGTGAFSQEQDSDMDPANIPRERERRVPMGFDKLRQKQRDRNNRRTEKKAERSEQDGYPEGYYPPETAASGSGEGSRSQPDF